MSCASEERLRAASLKEFQQRINGSQGGGEEEDGVEVRVPSPLPSDYPQGDRHGESYSSYSYPYFSSKFINLTQPSDRLLNPVPLNDIAPSANPRRRPSDLKEFLFPANSAATLTPVSPMAPLLPLTGREGGGAGRKGSQGRRKDKGKKDGMQVQGTQGAEDDLPFSSIVAKLTA